MNMPIQLEPYNGDKTSSFMNRNEMKTQSS